MHISTTRLLLCELVIFGLVPLWAQELGLPARQEASPAVRSLNSRPPDDAEKRTSGDIPDSPGATRMASLAPSERPAQQNDSQTAQQQSSPLQGAASERSTPLQESPPSPQKPAGTAAAEAPSAEGIAASEPAGAAIAPAKQRRARTIVLRVGAIVGAGVALGTVVALSEGTSSKPPGAH